MPEPMPAPPPTPEPMGGQPMGGPQPQQPPPQPGVQGQPRPQQPQQPQQQQQPPVDKLAVVEKMIQSNPRLMKKYGPIVQQAIESKRDIVRAHANNVRSGALPLDKVPAGERGTVSAFMAREKMSVPKNIPGALQKPLADAYELSSRAKHWSEQLDELRDPKTGELPNTPVYFLLPRLEYTVGVANKWSGLISDFSRERWAAISPLLHGVRRGDILQDMVKHTPNPYIDSPKQMMVKLDRLDANFKAARWGTLKAYGYDIDPVTKEALGDNPPKSLLEGREPPRPANVPDNYEFKDGPQGKGWYKPKSK